MIQKGQLDYAKRRALELFDAWNDVTGFIPKFTSYYYELCAVIENATEVGCMVTLGIPIIIENGELIKDENYSDC